MGRVFISFTLEDVGVEPFVSILHNHLTSSGIPTCFDNKDAIRSVNWNSLRREIEWSRVSVVVFAEYYGGSRECLEVLEKIMECHRATGQVVFPVFFGVDLWDVRMQKGRFGEEFQRMLKKTSVDEDTVLTWRRALFEVASFHRCFPFLILILSLCCYT